MDALFIGSCRSPKERNTFVSFKHILRWDGDASATLHLFADTRFRLFVNEVFVHYGPARFVTSHPEYDTLVLDNHLKQGENTIRVEVNYYGTSSYQSMPDGQPGFVAWGGLNDDQSLFATPGQWLCQVHEAWDQDSGLFSFAQNPSEILDTRILARELADGHWQAPRVLSGDECPWGSLLPRSVPLPSYAPIPPARTLICAEGAPSGIRVGFVSLDPDHSTRLLRARKTGQTEEGGFLFRQFITWLHSPREQEVGLLNFWSNLSLSGEKLPSGEPTGCGNQLRSTLCLRKGWNRLCGSVGILGESWSWLMEWPRDDGVTAHALPRPEVDEVFLLSPLHKAEQDLPPYCAPDDFECPKDWVRDCGDIDRVHPARLCAWERPAMPADRLEDLRGPVRLLGFDFQDEYYGQPTLEVDAPAGTLLDIAYDDWSRADGTVNLYGTNPFTDAADRFILNGGRQRIEVCNPRGGIFLQLTFRLPSGAEAVPVVLHDFFVRSRRLLNPVRVKFQSGDPELDWAFEKSVHTLVASTDEGYADCPWRERGTYIGDMFVNIAVHSLSHTDLSVASRCIRQFVHSQLPDGQLPCCTPSWLARPHEDFTLIWILSLHQLWRQSGDIHTVSDCWEALKRIWQSPAWPVDSSGLWNADGLHVFIDWGCTVEEKKGRGNTCLNLFRYRALQCSAELAGELGDETLAASYQSEAAFVKTAIEGQLWEPGSGRFRPSLEADTAAPHANVLALAFGVGDAPTLLHYLKPKLSNNFRLGLSPSNPPESHIELYFFIYLLPALAEHGEVELAVELLREHYGFLMRLGYPTLNECFARADQGRGSCCHSWSAAPAVFCRDWLAGLYQPEPGNPGLWILEPDRSPLLKVDAVFATPLGHLHVRWDKSKGEASAKIENPEGVRVVIQTPVNMDVTA